MNLDYIEIIKAIGKDKLNFSYLQKAASYEGAERYYFDRCKRIEVWYHDSGMLKIKGSLPYWLNGHNFYSSLNDWKEGLDYLGGCLNVNLYSGLVSCFEYGTIQEIPFPESIFLHNHIKLIGYQAREYKQGNIITGKEFISPAQKIKLYDVSRNIKNKLDKGIREELSRLYGWDRARHYIKIESHYRKPEALLGGNIYLYDILSTAMQKRLQMELINKYQSIMKSGKAVIPKQKKDINAGTLPLIVLKELEGIHNFRTEELLKAKLKEIPDTILSPADRKARQRIIRENLKKISPLKGISEYDITELLRAKITEREEASEIPSPFICEGKGEEILSPKQAINHKT